MREKRFHSWSFLGLRLAGLLNRSGYLPWICFHHLCMILAPGTVSTSNYKILGLLLAWSVLCEALDPDANRCHTCHRHGRSTQIPCWLRQDSWPFSNLGFLLSDWPLPAWAPALSTDLTLSSPILSSTVQVMGILWNTPSQALE